MTRTCAAQIHFGNPTGVSLACYVAPVRVVSELGGVMCQLYWDTSTGEVVAYAP